MGEELIGYGDLPRFGLYVRQIGAVIRGLNAAMFAHESAGHAVSILDHSTLIRLLIEWEPFEAANKDPAIFTARTKLLEAQAFDARAEQLRARWRALGVDTSTVPAAPTFHATPPLLGPGSGADVAESLKWAAVIGGLFLVWKVTR